MALKRQRALQVKTGPGWEYVFCYSGDRGRIVTTRDRRKALTERDLPFFQNKYGNNEFRATAE